MAIEEDTQKGITESTVKDILKVLVRIFFAGGGELNLLWLNRFTGPLEGNPEHNYLANELIQLSSLDVLRTSKSAAVRISHILHHCYYNYQIDNSKFL